MEDLWLRLGLESSPPVLLHFDLASLCLADLCVHCLCCCPSQSWIGLFWEIWAVDANSHRAGKTAGFCHNCPSIPNSRPTDSVASSETWPCRAVWSQGWRRANWRHNGCSCLPSPWPFSCSGHTATVLSTLLCELISKEEGLENDVHGGSRWAWRERSALVSLTKPRLWRYQARRAFARFLRNARLMEGLMVTNEDQNQPPVWAHTLCQIKSMTKYTMSKVSRRSMSTKKSSELNWKSNCKQKWLDASEKQWGQSRWASRCRTKRQLTP